MLGPPLSKVLNVQYTVTDLRFKGRRYAGRVPEELLRYKPIQAKSALNKQPKKRRSGTIRRVAMSTKVFKVFFFRIDYHKHHVKVDTVSQNGR